MYNNYYNNRKPSLVAYIQGSCEYPNIKGVTEFYQEKNGVSVNSVVYGLPYDTLHPFRVFAYHIHQGQSCTGEIKDPFAHTKGHYNPTGAPHPYHAGDLPPLFSNYGFAKSTVFTSRFTLNEIVGKTIIIHSNPDDFTSQPSGNSGAKIACGVITKVR